MASKNILLRAAYGLLSVHLADLSSLNSSLGDKVRSELDNLVQLMEEQVAKMPSPCIVN